MKIELILYVAMIFTGIPIGVFIDWLANKYGLPTSDGLNPVPWAILGLIWPITLLPFLIYCWLHNRKRLVIKTEEKKVTMKYIDADKLKAEIKERLHCNGSFDECGDTAWDYDQGMIAAYNYVLSFIDSLQQEQPKGDLAENIEMEWDSFNKNVAVYGEESEDVVWLNWFSFTDIATYFYELGLKARKEE